MLRKLLNALSRSLGYELSNIQKPADANLAHLYHQALERLAAVRSVISIAQIGANDGRINDQIYDFVIANKERTKIILFEPQDNVLPYLRENYKSHPSATIVNCAIGPKGLLKLYRLNPSYYESFVKRYLKDSPSYRVPTGFTSSAYEHVIRHVRGNLPAGLSIDRAIQEIQVPCLPLQTALIENGWNGPVDLLQVDVEGMDDQVLYECALDELRPILINFEYRHISTEKYTQLNHYLMTLGYLTIRYNGSNALAIRIALDGTLAQTEVARKDQQ